MSGLCVYFPYTQSIAYSDQQELKYHVHDACHAHFGSRYLRPINRYFHHWDPEVFAQVYKLNIKTPPAQATKEKLKQSSIALIYKPTKRNWYIAGVTETSTDKKNKKPYLFNLIFVKSFLAAARVNILNPHWNL